MAEWPRQPRANTIAKNEARTSGMSVQIKDKTGVWNTAFTVTTASRATTIVSRLNDLFTNYPGADLDFITPSYMNGEYVVVWSGVQWSQNQTYSTTTKDGKTYEKLYLGCYKDTIYSATDRSKDNVMLLATASTEDSSKPWEAAFEWANSIRSLVNGWNCTKDSTIPLAGSGYIQKLNTPKGSYNGAEVTLTGTYFGAGESLGVNDATSNIYHTCDLIVARPGALYPDSGDWAKNNWIRVSYGDKSVVARIADYHTTSSLDLSAGGVAYALGFTSGKVKVSKP